MVDTRPPICPECGDVCVRTWVELDGSWVRTWLCMCSDEEEKPEEPAAFKRGDSVMAVDVSLIAIEKERSLPWASFYLGGNGAGRMVLGNIGSPLYEHEPMPTGDGVARYYSITVEQARELLTFLNFGDSLYAGHEAVDAVKFVNWMTTFAGRGEYVLYVEVA